MSKKTLVYSSSQALELEHLKAADFVVLALPRSGSAWLTTMLNTSPHLLANHCPSWRTQEELKGNTFSINEVLLPSEEQRLAHLDGLYGVVSTVAFSPTALDYLSSTTKPVILLGRLLDDVVDSCILAEKRRQSKVSIIDLVDNISRLDAHIGVLLEARKEAKLPCKYVGYGAIMGRSPVHVLQLLLNFLESSIPNSTKMPIDSTTYYKLLGLRHFNITNNLY